MIEAGLPVDKMPQEIPAEAQVPAEVAAKEEKPAE
jgi:hypothetical protein